MASAGTLVVRDSGAIGIRASNAFAIRDADGDCDECCDLCTDAMAIVQTLLEAAGFSISGGDGSCYYTSLSLTYSSTHTATSSLVRVYYTASVDEGTVTLIVDANCAGGDVTMATSLINDFSAPFFESDQSPAVTVSGSTVLGDWSWQDPEADPYFGCDPLTVGPT